MAANYDVIQGIQYDPRNDDNQSIGLIQKALATKDLEYNQTREGFDNNQGILGSEAALYARNPDKEFLQGKIADVQSIPDLVNKKYNGDWAAAKYEIANKIQQTKPYFDQAKQLYDEQEKMAPVISKLSENNRLLWHNGINPRTQSGWDASGKFTGINLNPIERSDYETEVANKFSGLEKSNTYGIVKSDMPGYLEGIKRLGLNSVSPSALKSMIAAYAPEFENQTSWKDDPTYREAYGNDSSKAIADILQRKIQKNIEPEYKEDVIGKEDREASAKTAADNLAKVPIAETQHAEVNPLVNAHASNTVNGALQETGFNWRNLWHNTDVAAQSVNGAIGAALSALVGDTKGLHDYTNQIGSQKFAPSILKYKDPQTYAISDDGKKEMPGLANILFTPSGSYVAGMLQQKNESKADYAKRIDTVYKNEINAKKNVSHIDLDISGEGEIGHTERDKITNDVFGTANSIKKKGEGESRIPNPNLYNYTYTVVDKDGNVHENMDAKKFFDYEGGVDKFINNTAIDGFTTAERGHAWRAADPKTSGSKVYIHPTESNQGNQVDAPFKKLLQVAELPGARNAEANITFENGDTKHVHAMNEYDPKEMKFKSKFYTTGTVARNPLGKIVPVDQAYDKTKQLLKNYTVSEEPIEIPAQRLVEAAYNTNPFVTKNRTGPIYKEGEYIIDKRKPIDDVTGLSTSE